MSHRRKHVSQNDAKITNFQNTWTLQQICFKWSVLLHWHRGNAISGDSHCNEDIRTITWAYVITFTSVSVLRISFSVNEIFSVVYFLSYCFMHRNYPNEKNHATCLWDEYSLVHHCNGSIKGECVRWSSE